MVGQRAGPQEAALSLHACWGAYSGLEWTGTFVMAQRAGLKERGDARMCAQMRQVLAATPVNTGGGPRCGAIPLVLPAPAEVTGRHTKS